MRGDESRPIPVIIFEVFFYVVPGTIVLIICFPIQGQNLKKASN